MTCNYSSAGHTGPPLWGEFGFYWAGVVWLFTDHSGCSGRKNCGRADGSAYGGYGSIQGRGNGTWPERVAAGLEKPAWCSSPFIGGFCEAR